MLTLGAAAAVAAAIARYKIVKSVIGRLGAPAALTCVDNVEIKVDQEL